jgi:hypothetical protein
MQEPNCLEFLLARHKHELEILVDRFKKSLAIHEQEFIGQCVAYAEAQVKEREERCLADFKEALAKLESRRKENPNRESLHNRAQHSLENQLEMSLRAIEQIWAESVKNYQK